MIRNAKRGTRNALVLALLGVLGVVSTLDAHLMPDGQGSAKLNGNRVHMLVTIPVSILTGFDDDRNGLMSPSEYGRHMDDLLSQTNSRVVLDDGRVAGRVIFHTLLIPHADSGVADSPVVTIMRITEWDSVVTRLGVRADVFPTAGKPGPAELAFHVVRGDSTEWATLRAGETDHRFFEPSTVRPNIAGTAATLAGVTAALLAAALLTRRRRQSVASNLSSAA